MLLTIHLIVAIGSMAYATYMFFSPSRSGLRFTYVLVALTFVSGFALVFTTPGHITEVCMTGLLYLGYVSFAIVSSRHKLARVVR